MLRDLIKDILREATSDRSNGSIILPLSPGIKLFDKNELGPFTDPVSKYINAELGYDSYDGKMSTPKKKIKKMEKTAKKISIYKKNNPIQNDDDGDNINPFLKNNKQLKPYEPMNEWVEITKDLISEDLAVWFGTKKKPKGSKQPKGPWVNICRKVDGKHPPCGRPEASGKAYPKCRAAGVAGKMSDEQKRAACSQKRRAEKSEPKIGTGNKPTMTSYKPRKSQNESLDNLIKRVLRDSL